MWWEYYVLRYKNENKRYVETVLGIRGRGKNTGKWWRG
jgi:hypothetical protein